MVKKESKLSYWFKFVAMLLVIFGCVFYANVYWGNNFLGFDFNQNAFLNAFFEFIAYLLIFIVLPVAVLFALAKIFMRGYILYFFSGFFICFGLLVLSPIVLFPDSASSAWQYYLPLVAGIFLVTVGLLIFIFRDRIKNRAISSVRRMAVEATSKKAK